MSIRMDIVVTLKVIKPSMDGRARSDLLRSRTLAASYRPDRQIGGRAVFSPAVTLSSSVRIPEPLTEVVLPAFGKHRRLRCAPELLLILRIDRVEVDDIGDGQPLVRQGDRFDGIARPDLALGRHGEIEAGASALQHSLQ